MKILHVCTSETGGAGIAAMRLHRGLLEAGVESKFLSLKDSTINLAQKPVIPPSLYEKVIRRFKRKAVSKVHRGHERAGNFEIFSTPLSNFDITLHPVYQQADIIHLHWVADFLDYSSFFEKNQKPVVWTLHDMNPFQGGFHYYGDVQNNREGWQDLEDLYKEIKKQALSKAKTIHVVGLSNWILKESKESALLGRFPHYLIPNGIDLNSFKIYDKGFARRVFNLPLDKTIILFVSELLSNKRKGFDLLKESIKQLGKRDDVVFCAVGQKENNEMEHSVAYTGPIQDERLMGLLYAAADVFVLPSREDNLPNVMLEALACGTPVVGTPVGGLKDVIENGINGFLSREVTAASIFEALCLFLENKNSFEPEKIRSFIQENYSQETQSSRFLKLYDEVMKIK